MTTKLVGKHATHWVTVALKLSNLPKQSIFQFLYCILCSLISISLLYHYEWQSISVTYFSFNSMVAKVSLQFFFYTFLLAPIISYFLKTFHHNRLHITLNTDNINRLCISFKINNFFLKWFNRNILHILHNILLVDASNIYKSFTETGYTFVFPTCHSIFDNPRWFNILLTLVAWSSLAIFLSNRMPYLFRNVSTGTWTGYPWHKCIKLCE